MRIRSLAAVTLAALSAAPALAAPAGPHPGAAAHHARYGTRLLACRQGGTPAERLIAVHAAMQGIPATARMGIRIELLRRAPGASGYSTVPGPGLGGWRLSDPVAGAPGSNRLVVEHQVINLDAPARYRFRVGFRWYGQNDRVLATRRALTAVCAERAVPAS